MRGWTLLLLVALVACRRPIDPVGTGSRAEVPLAIAREDGGFAGNGAFTLAAPTRAVLELDGWWWQVDLTLDGVPLGSFAPGLAPASVALPDLDAGRHTLTVQVRDTGGARERWNNSNRMRRATAGRVWLRTLPRAHVSGLAVELREDTLVPSVELEGDVSDLRVGLSLSLDGDELAQWAAVPAGEALPTRSWSGPVWDLRTPSLVVATARLETAEGVVVDAVSRRVGLRDSRIRDGAMTLNGRRSPILALRASLDAVQADVARDVARAGANALELHGTVVGQDWIETTDEWGLGVVVTPRCDGNQQPGPSSASASAIDDQNVRLLRAAAWRPSVLAWICEGAFRGDDARCSFLTGDPLHRAVLGLEIPAAPMIGAAAPVAAARWVSEIAPGGFRGLDTLAEEFLAATGTTGPGGVILDPPPRGYDRWLQSWTTVRETLGATPWTIEPRRSRSVVVVTGLAGGELATLEIPGEAAVGAFANARGEARLEAWYEGAAQVVTARGRRAVVLVADRWTADLQRESHAVRVSAGG